MTTKRKIGNPLALAVLACLFERPMHPYEMASTMRERHQDESIKLNYGSLYTVMQSLQRYHLIEPQETAREGHRPERTVYRLTDAGRLELIDWLSDLICNPVREYTSFEAGLALLPVLPPEDAAHLLEQRCVRLETEIVQARAVGDMLVVRSLPRLFLIEVEYRLRLKEAELEWVRALAADIAGGTLQGIEEWRRFHQDGVVPKAPVILLESGPRTAGGRSS
jgi:DNA-binding PadR family transcriptional regulator